MRKYRRVPINWLIFILLVTVIVVAILDNQVHFPSGWHRMIVLCFVVVVNLGFAAAFGWFTHR